jgi:flagellar hook assembly protein FlgD
MMSASPARSPHPRSVLVVFAVVLLVAAALWPAGDAAARPRGKAALTAVSASPSAFYIGSSSTTVSYTLLRAARASVTVLDGAGDVARTLQEPALQDAGTYSLLWDGTDDSAAILDAGVYYVSVATSTSSGNELRVLPVELVTPALVSAGVSRTSFYGGAGASGSTTVTYTLAASATVSVSAIDAGGTTVAVAQGPTPQTAGSYAVAWNGTRGDGSTLPSGTYTLAVVALTAAGTEQRTLTVQYSPTPVASEASLALDSTGGYVLHAVVENWYETLNGQTAGDFYFDGLAQPWEYAAKGGVTLTLYVGSDPAVQDDTTAGGSVAGSSSAPYGAVDLGFPPALSWYGPGGAPLPLYYSVKLTAGTSSRWYPASGRYSLRAPAGADGHLQFAYMTDIQTPLGVNPNPAVQPGDATGPYTAIPRLSRSLGWNAVLSSLLQEAGANLVVFGGDLIDKGGDNDAPDDGATQLRTAFDNQQSYGPSDEWSLSRLAGQVPVALAAGNHDGIGSATNAAARWKAWAYSPSALPYYGFDDGDVHFVVLNDYAASADPATNYAGWIGFQSDAPGGSRTVSVDGVESTFTNSAQADWLIGAVATDKPWTVVVSHYPLFDASRTSTTAYNDANTTGGITTANQYYYGERDRLLAFFAGHGVDLILQGHNHMYRRHCEKVRSADGSVYSVMSFVTGQVAGGAPGLMAGGEAPFIDWIDLDFDGTPDPGEPLATADNSPFWDASYFGQQNSPVSASGYTGTPDTYHAVGEYNDGITFSYAMFQTGSDGEGVPTLTMTTKTITWNGTTHAWGPWADYETVQIPQVEPGMVPVRLAGP